MPFNTSGIFNRLLGLDTWQKDAAAGTKIEADLHDTSDNDLANALSQTITKWGWTTIEANIPWNGKKITNIGAATADTDVPQFVQVKNWKEFKTGVTITGSDANGRITWGITATGVTGLNWVVADVSWLAKPAEASKALPRLVMNNSGLANSGLVTGGAGSDVFIIDDGGRINNSGVLSQNVSYDGAAWRTISPGIGTYIAYSGGSVRFASNDVATITNPYTAFTPREYFRAVNNVGNSQLHMIKSASGKTNQILSYMGTGLRWQLQMGDGTAETAAGGSNFYLTRYNNAGTAFGAMHITRDTGKVTFYGDITTSGEINTDSVIRSTDTTMIIATATGGNIYLRVNGSGSATEQAVLNSNGDWIVEKNIYAGNGSTGTGGGTFLGLGLRSKAGSSAVSYGGSWMNLSYLGGFVHIWVGGTDMGKVQWQAALLDDTARAASTPLASTWEAVKALNPVRYQNGGEHWSFAASEIPQHLRQAARLAEETDIEDDPSPSLDQTAIIAALTKALQEAMTRIELLEARP